MELAGGDGSSSYELDSSRERWLSGALSGMSISELDSFFFNFFTFVFGYRKHGGRKDIVVETNRIEKKFCCRYAVVQSKTNSYLNVLLDSRLDFDFDFLLEKTALMLYLVDSQRQREDLLYRWLFCDYEHGGDSNVEFLREYWFHQPDEGYNADKNEIFRVVMKKAQRLVETWRSLDSLAYRIRGE